MAIPPEIIEIINSTPKYCKNEYFLRLFDKAINQKGSILIREEKVRRTKLGNNYIQPIYSPEYFKEFESHIRIFNDSQIYISNLIAGISVKYKIGVKSRNLFSLRHPRLRNGIMYVSFVLNSVNNINDLNKLKVKHIFDFKEEDNYFMTNSEKLSTIIDVIDKMFLENLITFVGRKQKGFLNNCKKRK